MLELENASELYNKKMLTKMLQNVLQKCPTKVSIEKDSFWMGFSWSDGLDRSFL